MRILRVIHGGDARATSPNRSTTYNIKDIGATCGFALRYFVWEVSATCDGSDDRLRQM